MLARAPGPGPSAFAFASAFARALGLGSEPVLEPEPYVLGCPWLTVRVRTEEQMKLNGTGDAVSTVGMRELDVAGDALDCNCGTEDLGQLALDSGQDGVRPVRTGTQGVVKRSHTVESCVLKDEARTRYTDQREQAAAKLDRQEIGDTLADMARMDSDDPEHQEKCAKDDELQRVSSLADKVDLGAIRRKNRQRRGGVGSYRESVVEDSADDVVGVDGVREASLVKVRGCSQMPSGREQDELGSC